MATTFSLSTVFGEELASTETFLSRAGVPSFFWVTGGSDVI